MGNFSTISKKKVEEVCKKFLEDDNEEFVCLLLPEVAEIKDEELFEIPSCVCAIYVEPKFK